MRKDLRLMRELKPVELKKNAATQMLSDDSEVLAAELIESENKKYIFFVEVGSTMPRDTARLVTRVAEQVKQFIGEGKSLISIMRNGVPQMRIYELLPDEPTQDEDR